MSFSAPISPDETDSGSRRRSKSKAVAVRVLQVDLSCPRLLDDLDLELPRDGVDAGDADVDQRVRSGIPPCSDRKSREVPFRASDTNAGNDGSKRCSHSTSRARMIVTGRVAAVGPVIRVGNPRPARCLSCRSLGPSVRPTSSGASGPEFRAELGEGVGTDVVPSDEADIGSSRNARRARWWRRRCTARPTRAPAGPSRSSRSTRSDHRRPPRSSADMSGRPVVDPGPVTGSWCCRHGHRTCTSDSDVLAFRIPKPYLRPCSEVETVGSHRASWTDKGASHHDPFQRVVPSDRRGCVRSRTTATCMCRSASRRGDSTGGDRQGPRQPHEAACASRLPPSRRASTGSSSAGVSECARRRHDLRLSRRCADQRDHRYPDGIIHSFSFTWRPTGPAD